MRNYYVYILSSKRNGTLYIGVTGNLVRRVEEHKNHLIKGFTQKYNINRLVYYEHTNYIVNALEREKYLKHLTRERKLLLIESINPNWSDLYNNL